MYHGLLFDRHGQCQHIPGTDERPPNLDVRSYPVVEQDGWIWLWPGDPAAADSASIPAAWGTDNERCVMQTGAIDYEADYQLINDNLTDLSHLDFVHETTLGRATGSSWSATLPKIQTLQNGIRVSRWFPPAPVPYDDQMLFESWNSYTYLLPGIFIMKSSGYLPGTAESLDHAEPTEPPVWDRVEQQAVTPISVGRTRYLFASGAPRIMLDLGLSERFFEVVKAAFEEDRRMIEAQQKIWDQTPAGHPMAFIPQDKGPAIIRRLIAARLRQELETAQ
jgi:vanillate O-demethylase monooxygenase subunit